MTKQPTEMTRTEQILAMINLFEHSQRLGAQEKQAALALQVLRPLSKDKATERFWASASQMGAAA